MVNPKERYVTLQRTVLTLLSTGFVHGTVRDPTTVCLGGERRSCTDVIFTQVPRQILRECSPSRFFFSFSSVTFTR